MADSYFALGKVQQAVGKLDQAAVLFDRCLSTRRAALGSRHPLVADALYGIGSVHNMQSNIKAAYDAFQDSLKIRLAVFGKDNAAVLER